MFWKSIWAATGCLFFMTSYASDRTLTPPNEPHDANFYVCYANRTVHCSIRAFYARYQLFKYNGCIISRTPCNLHKVNRPECRNVKLRPPPGATGCHPYPERKNCCPDPCRMKSFGCFDTYLQALNAFYRCAYN